MLITKLIYEKDVSADTVDISSFSDYRQKKILSCRNSKARSCSVSAALALKAALSELGYDEKNTEYIENDFGKPFFTNIPKLYFSLSHTDGVAVCVISDLPVGVDCERFDREVSPSVLRRFFKDSEISAYRLSPISLWTAKEAYTKLCGLPFAECVRDIEIPFFEEKTELKGIRFERLNASDFTICIASKIIV